MAFAATTTSPEPPRDTHGEMEELYARSYLIVRTGVGVLGAALPTVLLLGEIGLDRSFEFRGSLSAYYHSGVRDFFVGTLWATGVLLLLYLAWKPRTPAFFLSLLTGLGAIGLATVPTGRPGPGREQPLDCDQPGVSTACTPLQERLTEETAQNIHFVFTALFIGSALLLCLLYAWRERKSVHKRVVPTVMFWTCAALIAFAIVWIVVGPDITIGRWTFTSLYVGELIAVYAFAVSWLTEGRRLWRLLRHRPLTTDYPRPAPATGNA